MDFYGIGFSNIRFSRDEINYIYNYNYRINTFSEEVFIHEFIHTLERNAIEHGFNIPQLHDYEEYGYDNEGTNGLEEWYRAYMKAEIFDEKTNKYIGLPKEVYQYKPVNESNFIFPIEINFNEEPSNIFEDIKNMFNVIKQAI